MKKSIRPFAAASDEFIMVHKVLFVHVMPPLSGSAWKVLSFILFKTRGWQKEADDISYSQIAAGAGLASHETIRRALQELRGCVPVKQGRKIAAWRRVPHRPVLILARRNHTAEGLKDSTTFALNRDFEIQLDQQPDRQLNQPGSTKTVERSTQNVDTIEEPNKKRESLVNANTLALDDDFAWLDEI